MELIQIYIDDILDFLIENTPDEELSKAEAIFIFGHYEPDVAHNAAKNWMKNKIPIIVSGKGRNNIPKGFESEADFYKSILIADGIPEKYIFLEKESTNTLENVVMGMDVAHKAGINPKSIILCSLPPLMKRSCATFRKHFPEITVYGNAFPLPKEWFTQERIRRLLGEIRRLDEYAKKGDIVYVQIPEKVCFATQKILEFLP